MGRKLKVPYEDKVAAVKEYLSGCGSQKSIAKKYGVARAPFAQWINKYKTFGEEGLKTLSKNTTYSYELKISAIQDYLNGNGHLADICKKYKIHSIENLHRWILKYNGHEKPKYPKCEGDVSMTRGRKTTYEERIEIVSFCISRNNNYIETVKKYNISYQQIYAWMKKYETGGEKFLVFHQGRKSTKEISISELSEEEILKVKNKFLEAKNEKLTMENDILKKFQEIERRRG